MSTCLTCKKEILPRKENSAFPFCSARCRAVDLGKWLGEEFRVPGPPADQDQDQEEGDGRSSRMDPEDGADA
ncbi:MAG: DNA gyrase inhibitor YacG [Myxococcota bacterium]|nr:DNA gyrase inhibitor YacG [Myxococcota bacterium]